MKLAYIILTSISIFFCSESQAAIIVLHNADSVYLRIGGEITPNSAAGFLRLSKNVPDGVTVYLDSNGGLTEQALEIGRIIAARKFKTYVPFAAICHSACGLIWAAGSKKFKSEHSSIGFHASFDGKTRQQTGWINSLVGSYLARLGYSDNAIIFMSDADPDHLHKVDDKDEALLGFKVEYDTEDDSPFVSAAKLVKEGKAFIVKDVPNAMQQQQPPASTPPR